MLAIIINGIITRIMFTVGEKPKKGYLRNRIPWANLLKSKTRPYRVERKLQLASAPMENLLKLKY